MTDRRNRELVRERFTRTAEQFSTFSVATRSAEASRLVELAAPRADEFALDLACGPGTFTRAFAPHVRRICGLDLTPALLARAQATMAKAGITNVAFACGDATALPYPSVTFHLAACGYSLHHMSDPEAALTELARVLRPGGRVALVDLIIPEGADSAANNAIEIVRDASHTRTLGVAEFPALVERRGFRLLRVKLGERMRSFDDWMRVAGWQRGDAAYEQCRRMMAAAIARDITGFRPREVPGSAEGALEYVQTSLFVVAEKAA